MNSEKHLIIAIYICTGSFLLNEFIKFYMSQENIFLIQYIPLLLLIVSFIIYNGYNYEDIVIYLIDLYEKRIIINFKTQPSKFFYLLGLVIICSSSIISLSFNLFITNLYCILLTLPIYLFISFN